MQAKYKKIEKKPEGEYTTWKQVDERRRRWRNADGLSSEGFYNIDRNNNMITHIQKYPVSFNANQEQISWQKWPWSDTFWSM